MLGFSLLALSYVSLVVFVAAVVCRAVKIARMPIHLRWELYPVAHEKGRASYGGSYLEEPDWWTKPRESSLAGELKVMIPEILLLAGVWEHNRRHWLRSFPFHFGLYLLAGLIGLLLLGGIVTAAGARVSADSGTPGNILYHLTYLLGYAGLALGLIGSVALMVRRAFDPNYREYTKQADYFNLALFTVTFLVALAAHILVDRDFSVLRGFFAAVATGDFSWAKAGAASPTALTALEIILAALLLAYIPLTHMSHFFTKWFLYHDIRWSDEPNLVGGKMEKQIAPMLQYPVSWSAAHIGGDGKKNWVDVATSGTEEKKPQ